MSDKNIEDLRIEKIAAHYGFTSQADVLIVARQLRYLLGYEEIDRIIEEKLERQIQRIVNEAQA